MFLKFNEDDVEMMAACGPGSIMVITEQNNTYISSPKYPESYPNNMDCTWDIVADYDKRIALSLMEYDIENGQAFYAFLAIR